MSSFDHGEINIPLTGKRARQLDAEIQRAVAARHRAKRRAERDAKQARQKAKREKSERPVLTRDDLKGAKVVRTDLGDFPVVRINATTVTVRTDVGNLRIPYRDMQGVGR